MMAILHEMPLIDMKLEDDKTFCMTYDNKRPLNYLSLIQMGLLNNGMIMKYDYSRMLFEVSHGMVDFTKAWKLMNASIATEKQR